MPYVHENRHGSWHFRRRLELGQSHHSDSNEIAREKDYRKAGESAKALAKLTDIHSEDHHGNRLANFADLVLQILRREKKRAIAGLLVLLVGFVLQLLSRLYE